MNDYDQTYDKTIVGKYLNSNHNVIGVLIDSAQMW